MKDSKLQLSGTTLILHWLVGLTIIGLLAVGIYMEENEVEFLYPIHKSIGILILIPVLIRVYWRYINGWLQPASDYKPIEKKLSKVVHWVLIIGTVLMPVSGMMMSAGAGYGLDIFGFVLVEINFDPNNPAEILPLNETVAGLGHNLHGLGGNMMIIAILLHITGAIKHHVMDKDRTLKRMLTGK